MNPLNLDAQVDAFRAIVEMESRGQQLDELFARMKRSLLDDAGNVSLPDAVGAIDELKWHANKFRDQADKLEKSLGIQRGAVASARGPAAEVHHLRGSTGVISIPDVISMLGSQRSTGTLRITSKHGEQFVLEFLDGHVVHVVTDTPLPSQMLGSILVAQNKLTHQRLTEFLSSFRSTHTEIGRALAEAELVDREDLLDALEAQVRQLFQRVFGLQQASFCFTNGSTSDFEIRVTLSTTQLLLDAARSADESNRTVQDAPDPMRLPNEVLLGGAFEEPAVTKAEPQAAHVEAPETDPQTLEFHGPELPMLEEPSSDGDDEPDDSTS
ncbi:MAG: DUF4388 domain-containing protein [Planctomycetes bacterium]|nr:DUF4388 domain-containing protein [Planctomycetota bacterium]